MICEWFIYGQYRRTQAVGFTRPQRAQFRGLASGQPRHKKDGYSEALSFTQTELTVIGRKEHRGKTKKQRKQIRQQKARVEKYLIDAIAVSLTRGLGSYGGF